MTNRRLLVFIVGLVYVAVLAVTLTFRTPVISTRPTTSTNPLVEAMQENVNPDERQHAAYAISVANGHWPVLTKTTTAFESHQPPLYYAVCAVAIRAFPTAPTDFGIHATPWNEPVYLCRLISAVFILLSMSVAYWFTRRQWPTHPAVAAATGLFIGMLPMNLAQAASATNDSLLELIAILVVLIAGELWRSPASSGRRLRLAAVLGLVLALGMWTKASAVALIPAALMTYGAAVYLREMSIKQALREASITVAVFLLLVAPLWLRNMRIYGDPVGMNAFRAYFPQNHPGPSMILAGFKVTFMSFWGFFASMQLHFPGLAYVVLLIVSVAGLWGTWQVLRRQHASVSLSVLSTLVTVTVLMYVGFNLTYFQPQGRYLYPALLPIALGLVIGLRKIVPPSTRSTALAVGLCGLGALDLYTVAMIIHYYQ